MIKEELRKIYIEKRLSLSDAEYTRLNFLLCQNFFEYIDLLRINVLHTFLPLEKNKEPDTWQIIRRIRVEFSHIKISIPRVNNQSNKLENILFEGQEQLVENKWGIPEPKQGRFIEPTNIDLVVIPMVILDQHGNRVGYGKGFYDKFLATCRKDTIRVGVSLFEPVQRIEDLNEYDVPVQYCVTPGAFHKF